MPKLSASALVKRFTCPYCGVSLRTRQGLSGHIQYKHPQRFGPKAPVDSQAQALVPQGTQSKEKPSLTTYDEVLSLVSEWKKGATIMMDSPWEREAQENVIKRWGEVVALCKGAGIHLDKTDLKTYIVTSLAYVYTGEFLKNTLMRFLEARLEA